MRSTGSTGEFYTLGEFVATNHSTMNKGVGQGASTINTTNDATMELTADFDVADTANVFDLENCLILWLNAPA